MFNLPIMRTPEGLDQMHCRFIRMCHTMEKSENVKIKYLFKVCMPTARSIIRRNFSFLEKRRYLNCVKVQTEVR